MFETATAAETLGDNKGGLRADWSRGRSTLTGYYFLDQYSLDNPYPTGTGGANVPGFDATSSGRAQLMSLEHTMTFGASMLNEAHLSYMRNANAVGQPRGGVGPTLAAQGFTNIVPLKPSTEGIENLAFNDFTTGVDTTALVQTENIYEGMDAFSRIVGKHGLKFGGELHKDQINTHPDVVFNGSFSFNGSETGVDFADYLLGVASSYTQGQAESFYNRNLYMAAFAQDSWKATSRLTLNYGVRWDRIRPWLEKYNQLQTLIKGEQSQVFPGAPQGLGLSRRSRRIRLTGAAAQQLFAARRHCLLAFRRCARQPFGQDCRSSWNHQHPPRLWHVLHGLRGIVGGHHERESALRVYLHVGRAAAVRLAVYCGGYGRKRRSALPFAARSRRSQPEQSEHECELEPV